MLSGITMKMTTSTGSQDWTYGLHDPVNCSSHFVPHMSWCPFTAIHFRYNVKLVILSHAYFEFFSKYKLIKVGKITVVMFKVNHKLVKKDFQS